MKRTQREAREEFGRKVSEQEVELKKVWEDHQSIKDLYEQLKAEATEKDAEIKTMKEGTDKTQPSSECKEMAQEQSGGYLSRCKSSKIAHYHVRIT